MTSCWTAKSWGASSPKWRPKASRSGTWWWAWGSTSTTPTFPEELQPIATSLVLATGRRHSRLQILQAWLEEFEELYGRFLAREFAGILDEWRSLTVTLGHRVTVRQGPVTICGQALEVAPDGALLVETDAGKWSRVTSGEIAA